MKILNGVWFAGFRKGKKDPFAFAVILASSNMKMLMFICHRPAKIYKLADVDILLAQ